MTLSLGELIESGLALPEEYRATNWNFNLSTPIGFSKPFSIAIEFTKEDLKRWEVTRTELLTILQWSSKASWYKLDTIYIPEANVIQATLLFSESPCYLALAVRTG